MWLPSFGAQQVHDFNPGIGANGLFWTIQVPDDAVKIDDEKGTLTITLTNVAVVDQFKFPGGAGNNLGTAGVPATVSFHATYTKSGMPRKVRPTSNDPLSPFDWAGEMWTATNSGTFSVAYNDSSFSAQGTFNSSAYTASGMFGEMGTERNGSSVTREDRDEGETVAAAAPPVGMSASLAPGESAAQPAASSPKFKGKVPVEYLVH